MQEALRVVVAADANYALPLATMIESLMVHSSRRRLPPMTIIDAGLTSVQRWFLRRRYGNRLDDLAFVRPSMEKLGEVPVFGHVSTATYCRLLIGQVVGDRTDRVLYLDSDMLVLRDISKVLDIDLQGRTLGAVQHNGQTFGTCAGTGRRHLSGVTESEPYFNAGVLVVEMNRWREQNVEQRAIQFLAEHGGEVLFWDQDVLNVVLRGDWTRMEDSWNIPVNSNDVGSEPPSGECIVHFCGNKKPWIWGRANKWRVLYRRYAVRTPLAYQFRLNEWIAEVRAKVRWKWKVLIRNGG